MSVSCWVPAVVPSVTHSSAPKAGSAALNSTLPSESTSNTRRFTKLVLSLTLIVRISPEPASVPSEPHSTRSLPGRVTMLMTLEPLLNSGQLLRNSTAAPLRASTVLPS